jgi:hypothetical protein
MFWLKTFRSRGQLAPVGRVVCKRGEDLAWRWAHLDGGIKTPGGWTSPRRIRQTLFRRKFPPTNNRNHDPNQRRDRTTDGPGCGVAHLATTKHSESLQRPDQTEHCEDQPDRECNDESPSHIGILRAIWLLQSMRETRGHLLVVTPSASCASAAAIRV